MLPSLAASFASGDKAASRSLFGRSLRNALFLTIPSAGLLMILSQDVVPGVLKWSNDFNTDLGNVASMILVGYCVAIIAQTFVFIYNQAFTGTYNFNTASAASVILLFIIILFSGLLFFIMRDRSEKKARRNAR